MSMLRIRIAAALFLIVCATLPVVAQTGQDVAADLMGGPIQSVPDDPVPVTVLPEPALPDSPKPAVLTAPARAPGTAWFDPGSDNPIGKAAGEPAAAAVDAISPHTTVPDGWVPTWPDSARAAGGVVADRQVIAYYGSLYSRYMGVLGERPIEDMAADLLARAAEYDALNGPVGVAPAFHIIFGTVYEDGSIGMIGRERLTEYIEYAHERGILVFLDHQIGKFTVDEAIASMLPYLSYDNVHLAIDPEWATQRPGQEIGQIHASELNRAQHTISDYLSAHAIPGPKMLVVHQFNWRMIAEREDVRSDYPGVQLIHNADGFGRPADKLVTWEYNVRATNMPLKGFKLFYPKSWRDGGYDEPLLTPREVLQLIPVPVYIQYQ